MRWWIRGQPQFMTVTRRKTIEVLKRSQSMRAIVDGKSWLLHFMRRRILIGSLKRRKKIWLMSELQRLGFVWSDCASGGLCDGISIYIFRLFFFRGVFFSRWAWWAYAYFVFKWLFSTPKNNMGKNLEQTIKKSEPKRSLFQTDDSEQQHAARTHFVSAEQKVYIFVMIRFPIRTMRLLVRLPNEFISFFSFIFFRLLVVMTLRNEHFAKTE